ncbi:transposase [Enterococcus durans]|uniref:transposase n=1 Tax=Enterococcus durans TaxID=53345 RepID=UPI0039A4A2C1
MNCEKRITLVNYCAIISLNEIRRAFKKPLKRLRLRCLNRLKKKFTIFRRYQSSIANAFKISHSNGVTKGLNNKIMLIKRIAFGYRNFYNFRARIYLQQGLIIEN